MKQTPALAAGVFVLSNTGLRFTCFQKTGKQRLNIRQKFCAIGTI
jgi:hypothetical protein